jgi:hypothetical protein
MILITLTSTLILEIVASMNAMNRLEHDPTLLPNLKPMTTWDRVGMSAVVHGTR